jgi:hypothetical protein
MTTSCGLCKSGERISLNTKILKELQEKKKKGKSSTNYLRFHTTIKNVFPIIQIPCG